MELYELLIKKGKEEGIVKNVVGAIILNEKNEVLIMSRKTDDFMGGIDELPSENMEQGENIYDSLIREVKEETNLDVVNVKLYIGSFDYISGKGKKARQYNFVLDVKNTENIILTEHDEYNWLTIEEIRKSNKITNEVKYILEICYFNLKNYKYFNFPLKSSIVLYPFLSIIAFNSLVILSKAEGPSLCKVVPS